MSLFVNGHTCHIGQLGPTFLILDNPADQPPSEGEITVSIDPFAVANQKLDFVNVG
jgi:hypothetical protein